MSRTAYVDWPPSVWTDFLTLFCGDFLGSGIGREVYVLRTDPTKVVKIEMRSESFQNVTEWQTWEALKNTHCSKWLAPCQFISACGICLIQDRVDPLTDKHKRRKIPEWLTDMKTDNFGLIGDQVVARDYGLPAKLIEMGAFGSKLRKPEWWS